MTTSGSIQIPRRLPLLLTQDGVLLPGSSMRCSVDTPGNMELVRSRLLRGTSLKSTIIGVIPNTRDPATDNEELPAMHRIGTAALVVQVVGSNWPKPHYTLLVTGLCRFQILEVLKERPYPIAVVEQLDRLEELSDKTEFKEALGELTEQFYKYAVQLVDMLDNSVPTVAKLKKLLNNLPKELLPDVLTSIIRTTNEEKLQDNRLDIRAARILLDNDHYAMAKLKKRVLEYLAVRQLKNNLKGPILCFVGPPGVGKTSVGRSIAKTLGREFHRIALGGVCDQSDIRGHRRTYVGSMPGRIINGLKIVGANNPVFLLDEVDKLGKSLQGDPAAALLEEPRQKLDVVLYFAGTHLPPWQYYYVKCREGIKEPSSLDITPMSSHKDLRLVLQHFLQCVIVHYIDVKNPHILHTVV
ncbi:hypothetical protein GDO81_015752 [Engystomops pustulosus]|uniref:Lon N-terminal domain-containing protein n=1 Tax=Engystomops pustulosus TaxID=76066 RepID=A0AAV7ARL1_ENGPU|nr:hypothetical protein GDO81_015752 [Engystomops pustulosus]